MWAVGVAARERVVSLVHCCFWPGAHGQSPRGQAARRQMTAPAAAAPTPSFTPLHWHAAARVLAAVFRRRAPLCSAEIGGSDESGPRSGSSILVGREEERLLRCAARYFFLASGTCCVGRSVFPSLSSRVCVYVSVSYALLLPQGAALFSLPCRDSSFRSSDTWR